jgi:hypothetical protein
MSDDNKFELILNGRAVPKIAAILLIPWWFAALSLSHNIDVLLSLMDIELLP